MFRYYHRTKMSFKGWLRGKYDQIKYWEARLENEFSYRSNTTDEENISGNLVQGMMDRLPVHTTIKTISNL